MTDGKLVYIVDDDAAVRDSLRVLLHENGYSVRVFSNGKALLGGFDAGKVGCVVLDVRLPDMTGLEVQRRLAEIGQEVPVIMITGFGDIALAVSAMKAGAFEFLEKPCRPHEILARIGDAFAAWNDARGRELRAQAIRDRIATLTPREREVYERLLVGMTSKAIAEALGISQRTAEVHRSRVMQKTEAKNLSHLVRMALAVESDMMSRDLG